MKKSNLMKIVSILVISLIVMVFATNVYAAEDEEGFDDITNALTNSNTNANTNTNTNTNTNSSLTGNTANNTNNSSVYNNTNLPKTGVSDSIPVVMLVVVFGISAVYAYKKIKEYKNI